MAKWGSTDIKQLKELQERLKKLEKQDMNKVCIESTNEIALRMLERVKKRTPVGVKPNVEQKILDKYWEGYLGGTLRRAWTTSEVDKSGTTYSIDVINPEEYASYVEFGHKLKKDTYVPALGKRLKNSYVHGKYMMTRTEEEIKQMIPQIVDKKIEKCLQEAFDGD